MQEESALRAEQRQVRCCIAGGGPAGMMLGFLLARAGAKFPPVLRNDCKCSSRNA